MPQSTLTQAINRLDAPNYTPHIVLGISSDVGVREGILDTPEAKMLVADCAAVIPLMIRRLRKQELHEEYAPIAYYVIFGACKRAETLPVLADYIEKLNYTDDYKWLSLLNAEWQKTKETTCGFFYAETVVYALNAVKSMNVQLPSYDACTFFQERHEIAAAVRARYKQLTAATPESTSQQK